MTGNNLGKMLVRDLKPDLVNEIKILQMIMIS